RGKIKRVSRAQIECQPVRDFPVVVHKKFGNVRAWEQRLILNIDAERAHLAEQKRSQSVAAVRDARGVRARRGERVGACWIRGVDDIERLAADVGTELDRMPSAHP